MEVAPDATQSQTKRTSLPSRASLDLTPFELLEDQGACFDTLHAAADLNSLDIESLRTNANATVALWANWQEVKRRIPTLVNARSQHVDMASIGRFIGFLEGRLRIRVPSDFEEMLRSAKASSPSDLGVAVPTEMRRFVQCSGVYVPLLCNCRLRDRNQKMILNVGGVAFDVPTEVRESIWGYEPAEISVCLQAGGVLVLAHSPTEAGELWSIKSNRVVWRSEIWQLVHMLTGMGHTNHVQVVIEDERVIVFGELTGSGYMQIMRLSDGKLQAFFATEL